MKFYASELQILTSKALKQAETLKKRNYIKTLSFIYLEKMTNEMTILMNL